VIVVVVLGEGKPGDGEVEIVRFGVKDWKS